MPPPFSAMNFTVPRSWSPQSHFRLPKRSPVRQAECRRTGHGRDRSGLPTMIATWSRRPSPPRKTTNSVSGAPSSGTGARLTMAVDDLAAANSVARRVRARREPAAGGRARRSPARRHGRQHEGEAREFERRQVDRASVADRRVDARVDFQASASIRCEVDRREGRHRRAPCAPSRAGAAAPTAARAGRARGQARRARRNARRRAPRRRSRRRDCVPTITTGPTGAKFGRWPARRRSGSPPPSASRMFRESDTRPSNYSAPGSAGGKSRHSTRLVTGSISHWAISARRRS